MACAVPSLALVATSLVAQLMPKPPKRRRDPNSLDTPMAQENFLYLLSELEQAVGRGTIKWDAAAVLSALQRLDRLAAILRSIADQARDR